MIHGLDRLKDGTKQYVQNFENSAKYPKQICKSHM